MRSLIIVAFALLATACGKMNPAAPSLNTAAVTSNLDAGNSGLTIFNPGNNPDSCGIGGYGGQYSGSGMTREQDGKLLMFMCEAKLVSGTAVSQLQMSKAFGCTFMFTPGGTASVNCPQGFQF